jgi:superoxide reductase
VGVLGGEMPPLCRRRAHRYFPDGFETKPPSHVPVLSVSGMMGTLSVGATVHGQSAQHHITAAWVTDESGHIMFFKAFATDETPVVSFAIPVGTAELTPYEHCNLHGVWEGLSVPVLTTRRATIDALEANGVYNASFYPASYSTKPPSHVPVLTLSGQVATVAVGSSPHVMTEAHHIASVWVLDQLGRPIFYHDFNYTTDSAATAFAVPPGVTHLTPYAFCNLHQVWSGRSAEVTAPLSELGTTYAGDFTGGGATVFAPTVITGLQQSSVGSVTIKPGMDLMWTVPGAHTIYFKLSLSSTAWLAIGVSKDGNMVTDSAGRPAPSHVVVGSILDGVLKRTLIAQDPSGIIIDAVQDLQNTSFTQTDGSTTLAFEIPLSWVDQHLPGADVFHFIWAHGAEGVQEFGYHRQNKGRFTLSRAQLTAATAVAINTTTTFDNAVCEANQVLAVGQCYATYGTSTGVDYGSSDPNVGDAAATEYDASLDLTSEFRLSWTVHRKPDQDDFIDIMMQARTLGWLGFGLMAKGVAHGMQEADIFLGHVVEGVPHVYDAYARGIEAPLLEKDVPGHVDDVYDVRGGENQITGVTTLQFKRKLLVNSGNHSWDRSIIPGIMPCIFAYSRQGVDDLRSYHGPSRGFANIMFYRADQVCLAGFVVTLGANGYECAPCPVNTYEYQGECVTCPRGTSESEPI